jgi:hypothetical protein
LEKYFSYIFINTAPNSICTEIGIFSSYFTNCPTAPNQFFTTLHTLNEHNLTHHPPPPMTSPTTTTTTLTPSTIGNICTTFFYHKSNDSSHNLWSQGLPFIMSHYDHHLPDFRFTWQRHLTHRNKSNFLKLQNLTISALTCAYENSLNMAPFWWILFHLEMFIPAPSTRTAQHGLSIPQTIKKRINMHLSGDIDDIYNSAMEFTHHSQNSTSSPFTHNQTAQAAADSDQFYTAIAQATISTSVASINNSNIKIVERLYTPPVSTNPYPPPPPFHQHYSLPGNICDTIRQAKRHKGAGINTNSINMFISLVNAKISMMEEHLHYIFNKIYQNIIPHKIKQHFSDVYLFCLHKDPNDKSKLHPLGIPTAIQQHMATHIAKTFKEKFA